MADDLRGAGGNDFLTGRAGPDLVSGGDGNDTVNYANSPAGVSVNLVTGLGKGADAEGDRLSGIENIRGSGANDKFAGDAGANILDGGSGNDNLNGGAGDDTLIGGTGDDKIDGAAGADRMEGGARNDAYIVDNASDQVVELAGGGADLVYIYTISHTLSANVENLILQNSANLTGTGNNLNNQITGNSGANALSGLDGNDTLNGSTCNDVLIGGAGADAFVFNTPLHATNNVDQITDFAPGADKVQLENAVFTALTSTGPLRADAFQPGTSATEVDDRILYDPTTGNLSYDADGSGTMAGAIRFAILTSRPVLSNADFIVT